MCCDICEHNRFQIVVQLCYYHTAFSLCVFGSHGTLQMLLLLLLLL